jgi:hypothetical protein
VIASDYEIYRLYAANLQDENGMTAFILPTREYSKSPEIENFELNCHHSMLIYGRETGRDYLAPYAGAVT